MMAVFFSLKIWEESSQIPRACHCEFFGMLLILKYFYCVSLQSFTYRLKGKLRPRANQKQQLVKQSLGLIHSGCFRQIPAPRILQPSMTRCDKSQTHRSALVISHCSSDS